MRCANLAAGKRAAETEHEMRPDKPLAFSQGERTAIAEEHVPERAPEIAGSAPENARSFARGDPPRVAQVLLFTLFNACVLVSLLSLLRPAHLDSAIWPANALAAGLYFLLVDVAAPWCAIGMFVGTLAGHLVLGDTPAYSALGALASTLTFSCILLGCQWTGLEPGRRLAVRHVVGLLVVAFLAGIPGALVGATAVSQMFGASFWPTAFTWWLPDMASVVLLLPAFLLWPRGSEATTTPRAIMRPLHHPQLMEFEYGLATACLLGTVWLAAITRLPLLLELGSCVLLWFAFRLGPFPTALAAAAFAGAVLGLGVFDTTDLSATARLSEILRAQGRLVLAACPALIIAAIMDQRARQQRDLEEDQRRLAYALEGANDGIWDLHLPTDSIFFSARAYRMLGYDPVADRETLKDYRAFIHPDDLEGVKEAFRAHADGQHRLYQVELRGMSRNGGYVWLLSRGKVVERDVTGTPLRAVGTITDISQQKHLAAALEHAASHDPLTGLANRATFDRILEQARRRLDRDGTPFAVLLIDIDYFKQINDMHGHMAGDLVLTTAARRLQSALRAGDLAARFGGDEFAVIANGKSVAEFPILAERLHAHLSHPVETEGLILPTSFSLGLAVASQPGIEPTAIVAKADDALYLAKNAGRDTWRVLGMDDAVPRAPASHAQPEG